MLNGHLTKFCGGPIASGEARAMPLPDTISIMVSDSAIIHRTRSILNPIAAGGPTSSCPPEASEVHQYLR